MEGEQQRTIHPPTQTRMGGGSTSNPSHGSRTLTVNEIQDQDDRDNESSNEDEVGVLRLRGDMSARRPRAIQWDESVIDNEHMNKKKSKICCIYHKPREVGESSSESESDSDSDSSSSSSDSDSGKHGDHCNHRHSKNKKTRRNPREASPNAYERQPVYNKDRQKH